MIDPQNPIDWRYWAVLAGTALYLAARDAEKEPLLRRVAKTAASGLLAYGGSAELAIWLNGSEIAAAVIIMAFGLIVLDTATALIKDRALFRQIIRARLGAGGGDDEPNP